MANVRFDNGAVLIVRMMNDQPHFFRSANKGLTLLIVEAKAHVLHSTDAVVMALPFPAGSWRDPSSPLMHEIRKDGFDL